MTFPRSLPRSLPRHGPRRRAVAFLALTTCLGACTLRFREPDLGGIYSRAASHHRADRNPVIVIPGILGSTLEDRENGNIVWGAFGGGAAQPNDPEGARAIALSMAAPPALWGIESDAVATGVLDRLRVKVFGLPFSLKAYFHIISLLGAGGYRDESLGLEGEVNYGPEHYTCFQFPYDFRLDNVENARRLDAFIKEKRAYVQGELAARFGREDADVKFDIVAHSMGGLITRYFLRYGTADLPAEGLPEVTWAGAEHVERVVLVAPPNAGSLEALYNLVEGEKFVPILPRYSAMLIGTFVSAYQLLPRARHAAVLRNGDPTQPIDLYDPRVWEQMGWGLASADVEQLQSLQWLLPDMEPAERRRLALEYQRWALERAERFTAALDQPAETPRSLELFLVAGDAAPTLSAVAVDEATGALEVIRRAPGDSRVLRSSALADERVAGPWQPSVDSPVDWGATLFLPKSHLALTKDAVFSDNVLFWLLEGERAGGSP